MSDILSQIVQAMRPALNAAKAAESLADIAHRAVSARPVRDFAGSFRKPGIRVIAELKKASPSRGVIRADFPVRELAQELEASGAAALSVLTESNYFLGGLENLQRASDATELPLLRKDFIFDPYQIYEARANGADAVLLIAALLKDSDIITYYTDIAHQLGMSVLGEAHDEAEVELLLNTPVDLLGVNARNLRTFATDPERSAELIRQIPAQFLPVAESAIRTPEDIAMFREAGARGFLIGETLMRHSSPGAALKELIG